MTHSRKIQQGSATLIVTLILFGVMTLIVAFANRNHLFEQRASANQYRSTKAFEAAEAGLEWATAMLNNPRALNDACEEGTGATMNFRDRYLSTDAQTRWLRPTTYSVSGRATALHAACVKQADGWTCACPRSGSPAIAASATDDHPAFVIEFAQEAQPGTIRVMATGCTSFAGECSPGIGKAADAMAHVQVTLGILPVVPSLPLAPLTAKGAVDSGAASIGLHNADAASGGFTVHAGRAVLASSARFTTAPGGSIENSVIDNDASLDTQASDRLFASFFGMGKALWKQQPGVKPIHCDSDCIEALTAAIGAGHQMIWIDGDIEFSGSVPLGTHERPIVIVATGAANFAGPVQVHGVVYAASLSWHGAAGGRLRGAAISESSYGGDSPADFIYDRAALDSLNASAGSFARLPGSWKDF